MPPIADLTYSALYVALVFGVWWAVTTWPRLTMAFMCVGTWWFLWRVISSLAG